MACRRGVRVVGGGGKFSLMFSSVLWTLHIQYKLFAIVESNEHIHTKVYEC